VIGIENLDLIAGLDVASLDLARPVLLDADDVRARRVGADDDFLEVEDDGGDVFDDVRNRGELM
jgi:hypothetical protein